MLILIALVGILAVSSVAFGHRGKRGKRGRDGTNGLNGLNGSNGSNGMTGTNGMTGMMGVEGPSLFTFETTSGNPLLGSNSVTTDSNAGTVPDIVRTIEEYPSAFCTFELKAAPTTDNPFLVGLVNTNDINTFAFGFQFGSSGQLFSVVNQGGSLPLGTFNVGDISALS